MSETRKAKGRPKYLRKGGPSVRVSNQSIWEFLRGIERLPEKPRPLIQNPKAAR